jgi:hypothetical protein
MDTTAAAMDTAAVMTQALARTVFCSHMLMAGVPCGLGIAPTFPLTPCSATSQELTWGGLVWETRCLTLLWIMGCHRPPFLQSKQFQSGQYMNHMSYDSNMCLEHEPQLTFNMEDWAQDIHLLCVLCCGLIACTASIQAVIKLQHCECSQSAEGR